MAKMKKKWVVLCSTAIAAVYAAGYVTTDTQASIPGPTQSPQAILQPNDGRPGVASPSYGYSGDGGSSPSSPSASDSSPPSASRPVGQYTDGSYTGMGSNRRGSIEVTVTIKNDKITDVEVSHFAMHYSESDIVGLPDEVLQKQSAKVKNVSGATYSTQAFEDAVQNAISQAKNG
ncbi:FMN-binding protein [Cohnella nanjingensis]|uniref:FMN-binding protein n=1 Tax=Cohnella nanjingensis TaxID=1387779 RepID=A0A7X0VIE3_9BACL|nr:FMN-binding protein [Cohnella nanjingensis]MBB6674453.1 FMN-binding protein [Cohnella nanjingensis]